MKRKTIKNWSRVICGLCVVSMVATGCAGINADTTTETSAETIASEVYLADEETESTEKGPFDAGEFSVESDEAMARIRDYMYDMDWENLRNCTKDYRISNGELSALPEEYSGELFTSMGSYTEDVWQNMYALLFSHASIEIARNSVSLTNADVFYTYTVAFPSCYEAVKSIVEQYKETPRFEDVEADILEELEEKLHDGSVTDYLAPSTYIVSYDTYYHWIDGCGIVDIQEYAFNEIGRIKTLFAA